MIISERKFNCKKDPKEHLFRFEKFTHGFKDGEFTDTDLREKMPPVVDQGNYGSCTGNGLAGAYGFLELMLLEEGQKGPEEFDKHFDPVSRLFIYWCERAIEGDVSQDAGASISDGIAALKKWGVCRESTWPYMPANVFATPSRAAWKEAYHHKEPFAYQLDNTDLNALLGCLQQGFPIVFGVALFQSFGNVGADGLVPLPDTNGEQELGGHCMDIVGAILDQELFIVRNSWGTSWGDGGYCYIPFAYLTSPDLAQDFWTLRLA